MSMSGCLDDLKAQAAPWRQLIPLDLLGLVAASRAGA